MPEEINLKRKEEHWFIVSEMSVHDELTPLI
jgi:hypothetical protein